MNTHRLGAIVVCAIAWLLLAADAPPAPTVKVVGLEIHNPPEQKSEHMFFGNKGVKLELLITDPNRAIVGMDSDASKITHFTDGKGTDLSKPDADNGFSQSPFQFPEMSEDGHSMTLSVASSRIPIAGATHIKLTGSVSLQCGADPKTVKTPDLALAKGTTLKLGDVPVSISEIGSDSMGDDNKMQVTFHATHALTAVKTIRFLKSDGSEIKSRYSGSSSMSFGGAGSFDSTYNLAEKVDKATVEVTWWGSLQTVELPLNLDVGLGF